MICWQAALILRVKREGQLSEEQIKRRLDPERSENF